MPSVRRLLPIDSRADAVAGFGPAGRIPLSPVRSRAGRRLLLPCAVGMLLMGAGAVGRAQALPKGAAALQAPAAPVWSGPVAGTQGVSSPAQTVAPAAAAASASLLEAAQWLARIQHAAANRSYHGTLVVTGGGSVSSSRITHISEGGQRYERVDALDGRARLQLRHNDQLLTQWPAAKLAVAEQREPVVDFPGLPASAGQRVIDNYEMRQVGTDRVAGHEADVLMVRPRDKLRFAQRWWVERGSGLLLRADILGPQGELLESSTFTDLALDNRSKPEVVLGPMKRLEGWRVQRPQVQRVQLQSEGWSMARSVPGFQMVSCSRRPLDGAAEGSAAVPVLQSVFSDGLTHVSVFIEPYDASRHRQALSTSMGATHTLTSRHAEWWVTVMGDVPMATLRQFDQALERAR